MRLTGAMIVFAIAWMILSFVFGAFSEDEPGAKAQWTSNKIRGMVLALFAASLPAAGLMWGYVAAVRRWTRPRIDRVLKVAGASLVGLFVCLLIVGIIVGVVKRGEYRKVGAELAPVFAAHLHDYTTELRNRLLKGPTVDYRDIGGYYHAKDPELAIPGKVVVVNLGSTQIDPLVFGGLKPELRAATPEEVKTVVWLEYRPDPRGKYIDGRSRVVILCVVTILDPEGPQCLRRLTFEGSVPGETLQSWENPTGDPPGEEIVNYLNYRLKIR